MDNQTDIITFANKDGIDWVCFEPEISAICSIGKKPFYGKAYIIFQPADKLLEFTSMEEFISKLKKENTTIEGLTRILFDKLVRVLGDIPLRVEIHARTTVHAPASALIEQGEFTKWIPKRFGL